MEKFNLRMVEDEVGLGQVIQVEEARSIVFSYFMSQLLESAEQAGFMLNLSTNIRIMERLANVAMPGVTRGKVRAFLFAKAVAMTGLELPEGSMRKVFQVFYEELCEIIGPVKTDECVGMALAQTKLLPEAVIYVPQQLM